MRSPGLFMVKILEHHLDTFGHVNNAKYLEFFEGARWESITARGYGVEEVLTSGIGPVVLELTIKFRKELRLREEATVSLKWEVISTKMCIARQEIHNSQGELCTISEAKFGLIDTRLRKLVPMTEKWLRAIQSSDGTST